MMKSWIRVLEKNMKFFHIPAAWAVRATPCWQRRTATFLYLPNFVGSIQQFLRQGPLKFLGKCNREVNLHNFCVCWAKPSKLRAWIKRHEISHFKSWKLRKNLARMRSKFGIFPKFVKCSFWDLIGLYPNPTPIKVKFCAKEPTS